MEKQDAEEFTQSLGQIVGGSWRQIKLAKRLGVPQALGLEVDEWVNNRLGGYIKMNVEDRRGAAHELKGEKMSTRDIAETLGVGIGTVHRDLHVPNGTEDPSTGAEIVPNGTAAIAPLDAIAALSALPGPDKVAHVSSNSGDNEWYTPPAFIDAARLAMGRIDLDPASSEIANRTVCAETFFTAEQNGLDQTWSGSVWMNPPYAQPLISDFADAVSARFETGQIEQACVLVNNATETAWFQRMLGASTAVCFPRGRIRFLDPNGNPGAPLQGQAVIYMGPRVDEFCAAFATFGPVVAHVS